MKMTQEEGFGQGAQEERIHAWREGQWIESSGLTFLPMDYGLFLKSHAADPSIRV